MPPEVQVPAKMLEEQIPVTRCLLPDGTSAAEVKRQAREQCLAFLHIQDDEDMKVAELLKAARSEAPWSNPAAAAPRPAPVQTPSVARFFQTRGRYAAWVVHDAEVRAE